MNTLAKAAAAGSLVAAAAMGLALVLPAQPGASVASRPAGTTRARSAHAGLAGRHGRPDGPTRDHGQRRRRP